MYRKDDWEDDALIGLDVGGDEETSSRRNKVVVGSTSKPSRKRPRQSNIISSTTRPQKPKPPPAPPASLVSLMKKDKSVLHYFKSLHENTTYDVDKWKHEAAYWKRMASSATKNKIAGGTKTPSAKKRQRKSINGRQKKQNSVEGKGNGEDEEGSTIPITDEALFEEFSDDDDGDDDKDDVKRSTASSTKGIECNNNTTNSHSTTEEQSMRRRSLIFGKLLQAKQYLDLLGVSLVVIEVKPSFPNEMIKQSNDEGKTEADTSEEQTDDTALPSERILHRRSDEKVVADMMASLRSLIEASSCVSDHSDTLDHRHYQPFCSRGQQHHCPNLYIGSAHDDCDMTNETRVLSASESALQHPASIGLKHLIDVLTIMSVYCHDSFDDHEWNLLFEECSETSEENMTFLKIGFRNRSLLVKRVLSSLHVEITRTWASIERASNFESTSMHFYPTENVRNQEQESSSDPDGEYSAKNYSRLVNLEERIAHGRIASLLYRRLGDFQKATELVLGYLISSTPSLGIEYYHPKIPPVLSMCVLESLLSPEAYDPINAKPNGEGGEWFCQFIQLIFTCSSPYDESQSLLLKVVAFATHSAAKIWEERCTSSDKRIRDIALIEVAAYKRLLCLSNGAWLRIASEDKEDISRIGHHILSGLTSNNNISNFIIEKLSRAEVGLSCILSLITTSKADEIIKLCENILANERCKLLWLLPACCFAHITIVSRMWESIKLVSPAGRSTAAAAEAILNVRNELVRIIIAAVDIVIGTKETNVENIDAIIQCYQLIGDALGLQLFAKRVVKEMKDGTSTARRRIMSTLIHAAENITVRVINLQRRPDRLLDFFGRTVNDERILVMKGVAKLLNQKQKATEFSSTKEEGGNFAFDGKNDVACLKMSVGDCALSDFVKEEWVPMELAAFDTNAGSDFKEVRTTTSEKACALSHIATWFGVLSSINMGSVKVSNDDKKAVRLITISGFARGPPMLNQNEDMNPSPVCVVLEDDAILCDRFVERLDALLDELPRDFHFCHLGYSRPRLAPMVEYSSELGIPTCLWYLTGYILSAAGAQHLISSLPVVGPVDNWIAIKLRDNWANRYGEQIGVGKHTKAKYTPSPKDLSRIMKFRAFAANVPLCSQKQVATASRATGEAGGNWRSGKDSDIKYSGN